MMNIYKKMKRLTYLKNGKWCINTGEDPSDNSWINQIAFYENSYWGDDTAPVEVNIPDRPDNKPCLDRAQVLDKAKDAVTGYREKQYGSPEASFQMIADLWSDYARVDFTPFDVAMLMALLKIARIRTGTATEDSFVDLAGYAACGAEIALKGQVHGE